MFGEQHWLLFNLTLTTLECFVAQHPPSQKLQTDVAARRSCRTVVLNDWFKHAGGNALARALLKVVVSIIRVIPRTEGSVF